MTTYTYQIISTISARDESDVIEPGDVICDDPDAAFSTKEEAIAAGQHVLSGLSGGRAFDKARDSAEVIAVPVEGKEMPLLTTAQAARLLGVKPVTVRKHIFSA